MLTSDEGRFANSRRGARCVFSVPLCLHTRQQSETLYLHTRFECGGIPACGIDDPRHARGRGGR